MLDDLSEGIFGNIKLGVEKKAKERVAIKIIKKKKKANLQELHEKLRAKIESFKTNKGKRTQKKEQKRIQQENDRQKNKENKESKEKINENKSKKENKPNKENIKNKKIKK